MAAAAFIHPTADVAASAVIGEGARIWHQAQVREGAVIGRHCILGKAVYIDHGVRLGDNVKVQNYVAIYHGVTLEDGVFVGPNATLLTDRYPRAVTPDGRLKGVEDWEGSAVRVCGGASIGAGAVVLPGVTIGRWAMVGAGAVVAKDVPDYGLALGNPARLAGYVCRCGRPLMGGDGDAYGCPSCGRRFARRETGIVEL